MAENYEKYIVTTEEHETRLHRTSRNNLTSILKKGVRIGPGPLESTTDAQSMHPKKAKMVYERGKDHGDTTIVLHISREIWNAAIARSYANVGCTQELSYQDGSNDYFVKPEFIVGRIDRDTDEFHKAQKGEQKASTAT